MLYYTNLILCINTKATLVFEVAHDIDMTLSCCPEQRLLSMLQTHKKLRIHSLMPYRSSTQQQTSQPLTLLSIDGTDGRTPDRYTDPALHTMRAASIIIGKTKYSKKLLFASCANVCYNNLCNAVKTA